MPWDTGKASDRPACAHLLLGLPAYLQRSTVEGAPDHQNHSADEPPGQRLGGFAGCPQGRGSSITGCHRESPAASSSCKCFTKIHARWLSGACFLSSILPVCLSGQDSDGKRMSGPFQGFARNPADGRVGEAARGQLKGAPLRNAATTGLFARQVLPSAGAEGPGRHPPYWNILTTYLRAIGEGTQRGHLLQPLT